MKVPSNVLFPIVAIGGSAGGLKAFTAFFRAFEALSNSDAMAFVVISHLSPDHKSHMAELLQHTVRLPVLEVTGRTRIEAGSVYVLAPGQTLLVRQGWLEPRKRVAGPFHHPVDDLFASLAKDAGSRAIAIVMSGTGSNGSAGLSAVREGGGLVLAQSPESAEFGEMPRRAINTGLVDSVLLPEQMSATIVRYAEHLRFVPATEKTEDADAPTEQEAEGKEPGEQQRAFKAILSLLRARTSIDFRNYKTGTLQRRIGRRIGFLRLNGWDAYAKHLREKQEEVQALTDDLLIAVTSFFRDREAWDTLRDEVLRPVIAAHQTDRPFRAWVAGCASGEEAYSLAILLMEEMAAQEKSFPIEIFATDPSAAALTRARAGLYPEAAVQYLPKKLIQDYFEIEDDIARVSRKLRECVVFAPQNAAQDPPFSRIDLLICRNVLIYLQSETQQKVIRLFHFALSEGGYLFLGSAETLGGAEYLFETVSKKWRLYRRLGPARHDIIDFPIPTGGGRYLPQYPQLEADQRPAVRRTEEALRALASHYAPPSVLTDGNLQALYYHGAVERFLKPQLGEPTQDLGALARDGLGLRLRRLVEKAKETNGRQSDRAQLRTDGKTSHVLIEVFPVKRDSGELKFLVSFIEAKPARASGKADLAPASPGEQELEAEVKLLREEIRTSADVMNRSQEELKSYNEEMMSMNEELRAANEELETSKEELQSLNEELNTVNGQLRAKVDELHERTSDLDNLLSSTDVATLFLGRELQIRWFSPGIVDLFNVRPADIGRRISDLAQKVTDEGFEQDCEHVLRTLAPAGKQVRTSDERWFVRRILPYRTRDDRIDGLVVTFSDVTAIQAARRYAESVVEAAPTPLLVLDSELRVISANPAFYSTFHVSEEQTVQRLIYDLGNGQWNIPALREFLTAILERDESFNNQEVEHTFEKIGKKTMLLNGRRVEHAQLILLVIEDITQRKCNDAQLRMLMQELNHRVKNVLAVVQGLASQTLASSNSLGEFGIAFKGRLCALARGHSLLLKRDWTSASLMQLVQDVTQAIDLGRVAADGPDVELPPRKALSIHLALHELLTNATKYGALSQDGGRVTVRWDIKDKDIISLIWQESRGPPVACPKGKGFGTNLIIQLAHLELDGDADFRFEPEGLRCEITFSKD